MEIEEFQREWQALKSEPIDHDEVRRMMHASPASRFRSFTRKEVLDMVLSVLQMAAILTGFQLFGFDAFNPMTLSWCGFWTIVAILDEHIGLRYLRLLPHKDTIQESLTYALSRIKRIALISRIIHIVIWVTLVLTLAMNVPLGKMNVVLWALMLSPVLAAVIWWSSRKWSRKRDEVKALLDEFGEEPSLPAV